MSTGVIFILGKGVTPIFGLWGQINLAAGSSAPGFSMGILMDIISNSIV